MPADPQRAKRQDLYDSLILEHQVPDLLAGLTVAQYLSYLPQRHTSPETENTAPQLALHGLQ